MMFQQFLFALCFLCGGGAFALGDFPRSCESYPITTQENLNVTQFLGQWYDIEHSKKENGTCTVVELNRLNDMEVTIEHFEYGIDGTRVTLKNDSVTIEGVANGSMLITYRNVTNVSLVIVSTDYKDYAILWLCKNSNANESQQELLIWARNDTLPANSIVAINASLARNNLTHLHTAGDLGGPNRCQLNQTSDVHNGTVVANNGTVLAPSETHNSTSSSETHNGTSSSGVNLIHEHTVMMIIVTMLIYKA